MEHATDRNCRWAMERFGRGYRIFADSLFVGVPRHIPFRAAMSSNPRRLLIVALYPCIAQRPMEHEGVDWDDVVSITTVRDLENLPDEGIVVCQRDVLFKGTVDPKTNVTSAAAMLGEWSPDMLLFFDANIAPYFTSTGRKWRSIKHLADASADVILTLDGYALESINSLFRTLSLLGRDDALGMPSQKALRKRYGKNGTNSAITDDEDLRKEYQHLVLSQLVADWEDPDMIEEWDAAQQDRWGEGIRAKEIA